MPLSSRETALITLKKEKRRTEASGGSMHLKSNVLNDGLHQSQWPTKKRTRFTGQKKQQKEKTLFLKASKRYSDWSELKKKRQIGIRLFSCFFTHTSCTFEELARIHSEVRHRREQSADSEDGRHGGHSALF